MFNGRLFGKLTAPALFQAVRATSFDFDKYSKSLDDQGLESKVSAINADAQKPKATFWKREHKVTTHRVFASDEYKDAMQKAREISVNLTVDDTWQFIDMITDRNKWIDARVLEGMNPNDALEKMNVLIRIRNLDGICRLNKAIEHCLEHTWKAQNYRISYFKFDEIGKKLSSEDYESLENILFTNLGVIAIIQNQITVQQFLSLPMKERNILSILFYDSATAYSHLRNSIHTNNELFKLISPLRFAKLSQEKQLEVINSVSIEHCKNQTSSFYNQKYDIKPDIFLSSEYQSIIRSLGDDHLQKILTECDTPEFIAMMTDKEKWIRNEVEKGMAPLDALEKMKALIRIRELDGNARLNNAIDVFRETPRMK
ncbi:MAG: hypothetical protein A3I77_00960 [Gammaproteobacteria bacterium RIFCSPLOWO2_02_FULL_42_14]|nr:MAG: hypothetical protein A3B71_04750 [Gammaproteobacteria bacterium RIFCSPHIGHO2_02_FULL_42_43]OGT28709.1 MAG: hypothetical protein A2624_05420 [Gammaproteobacteria bacterium RIFCSPHIGHO2_01_FULL_42_8]OGT61000.1 MAG: hypothetical protein A3I77_00960 [Gammaproteobacteria bacterium RIFCSPLOWO2_02_FULL_42_14]OGT85316.1 MAG: hypothetical protein A3G86_05595 [Gammaproteobacteria bacterium RIFCSPLOWO2_12_FULL_42_18]